MKILVIGSGGREHAICAKIASSPLVDKLYCAPGNAGITSVAECVPIKADALDELEKFAVDKTIGLTVVGPELPLTLGIADLFDDAGLAVLGPRKDAAMLEGSKAFSKEVMEAAGVPTAAYRAFTDAQEAEKYAGAIEGPCVVKADGLAAGKGVIMCSGSGDALAAVKSIMRDGAFGSAGARVVIEDLLEGEEVSFIALTDGEAIVPLASSQDHKRAYDNDEGPNTGGMGAYSPSPLVDKALHEKVMNGVMIPVVREMAKRGAPYRGFLYAGLMVKNGVPYVLEFNARLGDPETQPLMFRMRSDIVPFLVQAAAGKLDGSAFEWDPRPAVCVVMASGGYPGDYLKGMEISGLDQAASMKDVLVYHAGTSLKNGRVVTSGGRVLGVTAMGSDYRDAIRNAYAAAGRIGFDNCHYRRDIGRRAVERQPGDRASTDP